MNTRTTLPIVLATFLLPVLLVLAVPPQDDGWTDLFDGESLDGWEGDLSLWRVEEGRIVGEGADGGPVPRTVFLFHERVATDFVLEAEMRITAGNSGLQYRSVRAEDGSAIGYQADLDAANEYTGILYEAGGRAILGARGALTVAHRNGTRTVVDRGDAGRAAVAHRPGEWVRVRVTAIGETLRHEIDGVTTCEVVDRTAGARRSGRFAIQLHQGDPMRVEVRSIRVRPLGGLDGGLEGGTTDVAGAGRPPVVEPSVDAHPHWIWMNAEPIDAEHGRMELRLRLPRPARSIVGHAVADNEFSLRIDDDVVATGDDWMQPTPVECGPLPAGEHLLTANVENESGPAGFALSLLIEYEDGSSARVVSDERWRTNAVVAWVPVHIVGPVGAATPPWGAVFVERVAPGARSWKVPPGFRAELVYSAEPGEGSWASMVVEGERRIIVSPESGELLRIILPAEPDGAVRTESVAEGIGNAQGLLIAHGSLWVHVTDTPENGGGLWRLTDADLDGTYEKKQRLGSYGVRNEHGAHGLALGPDGWIHLAIGNHVDLPEEVSRFDPYRNFAEDTLLQRIEDPNGHAAGIRAPAGQIIRVSPDGARWERIAGGLRNPYDLVFHIDGELFTYDADMEWDVGTPWYRAPRVVHLTSGAEIGWRSGNGKWPDGLPEMVPPVVDTDLSSPTGVATGLAGTFPGRWGDSLFLGDWAYGRILAVHLEPEGATWRGEVETFVEGTPMNITDLEFGVDGALYLVTGGRGTQSGLYRVSVADRTLAGESAPDHGDTSAGAEDRARRRKLEGLHRRGAPERDAEIWTALGDRDPAIRSAARIALERLPLEAWRDRALAPVSPGEDLLARRVALLALARVGDSVDRGAIAALLDDLPPAVTATGDRLELRTAQIVVARSTRVSEGVRVALLARSDPGYPAGDPLHDRLSAELLVRLRAPFLRDRMLAEMARLPDPAERLHRAVLLAEVDELWDDGARARLDRALAPVEALEGGYSLRGYVRQVVAALRERAGMPPGPADAVLEIVIPDRVREWTTEELVALATAPAREGDAELARTAYRKALCVHCHRRDGVGGGIGNDLTGSARRYTPRDLVAAIVDPSRDISTQYDWTIVETAGDVVLGRVLREDDDAIMLNTSAFGYEPVVIERAAIVNRERSPMSPMPPGLLDGLDEKEAGALLRWLLAEE